MTLFLIHVDLYSIPPIDPIEKDPISLIDPLKKDPIPPKKDPILNPPKELAT